MNETDFAAINQAALAHCPSLLERLLPGGKVQGHEYVCADLAGGNGSSLSVNIHTGKWADFSTDDSGKDLIALVATIENVNQHEAAKMLAAMAGYSIPAENRTQATARGKEEPKTIIPVPDGINQPADINHPGNGKPTAIFTYRNERGQLLGFVCRFNKESTNGKGKAEKVFAPFIYTSQGWRWKKIPEPYPLYGLDSLPKLPPNSPIIVCEGKARQMH